MDYNDKFTITIDELLRTFRVGVSFNSGRSYVFQKLRKESNWASIDSFNPIKLGRSSQVEVKILTNFDLVTMTHPTTHCSST